MKIPQAGPSALLLLTLLLPALAQAQAPPLTLTSPNPEEAGYFGYSVSGVPDVDGDGRSDLLIGAELEDVSGRMNAGRAYLFSGATGALLGTLTSPNPERFGNFGRPVSGVADGDGRIYLLVGAYRENVGASSAGRAYLFSGATIVAAEPGLDVPALALTVVPNPARERATLTLSLPTAGAVRLSVHDVLGREIAVLLDGAIAAGTHTAVFDAEGLASGVYVWRLASGGTVQTGRLTLLE